MSSNIVVFFGVRFAHASVGEGENRHLVLERCQETSMYVVYNLNFLLRNVFDCSNFCCVLI